MKAHRHTSGTGHEHEFEPQRGLPEALPAGEHLLWQGQPDWRMLARKAFHVRKLVVYFAGLMVLRFAFRYSEGASIAEALTSTSVLAADLLGCVTCQRPNAGPRCRNFRPRGWKSRPRSPLSTCRKLRKF